MKSADYISGSFPTAPYIYFTSSKLTTCRRTDICERCDYVHNRYFISSTSSSCLTATGNGRAEAQNLFASVEKARRPTPTEVDELISISQHLGETTVNIFGKKLGIIYKYSYFNWTKRWRWLFDTCWYCCRHQEIFGLAWEQIRWKTLFFHYLVIYLTCSSRKLVYEKNGKKEWQCFLRIIAAFLFDSSFNTSSRKPEFTQQACFGGVTVATLM